MTQQTKTTYLAPSPLNLQGYGITEYKFSTSKDYDATQGLQQQNAQIRVKREHKINQTDPTLHLISLEVTVKARKKNFPYSIKAVIAGIIRENFVVDEPEIKKKNIVAINGASLLYGALREYIYITTAHSMCGPYMLPTMSFLPPMHDK